MSAGAGRWRTLVRADQDLVLLLAPALLLDAGVELVVPALAALLAGPPGEVRRDERPAPRAVLPHEGRDHVVLLLGPRPLHRHLLRPLLLRGPLARQHAVRVHCEALARLRCAVAFQTGPADLGHAWGRPPHQLPHCCPLAHLAAHRPQRSAGAAALHGATKPLCASDRPRPSSATPTAWTQLGPAPPVRPQSVAHHVQSKINPGWTTRHRPAPQGAASGAVVRA
jgi:hypothetical protein